MLGNTKGVFLLYTDICLNDIEILNNYKKLTPAAQRELLEYMRYLLCKQYKRDVMVAVFHNKLINNLLHSLLRLIERDEIDLSQVTRRVMQIKELYYGLFEKVHNNYAELIEDLDSNEAVKEFGRNGFSNLEQAIRSSQINRIKMEVIEFYQGFESLARHREARKIVAV
ncbi:MAG TPA: hypothetical protein DER60_02145 [Syntrophomonas sp.]|nr:hypothetical protein [Syntrophomonas sp.]